MTEQLRDAGLAAHVKSVFMQDNHISDLPIRVEVANGVVWLKGHTDNEQHRNEAEYLARGVAGVKSVVNELTVEEKSQPGGMPEVAQ